MAVDAFEAFVAFVDAVVVAVADVGAVVDVGAAAAAVGVDVVGLAAVDGDGAAGHDTGRSVTGDHGQALRLGEQPGLGPQVEWQVAAGGDDPPDGRVAQQPAQRVAPDRSGSGDVGEPGRVERVLR